MADLEGLEESSSESHNYSPSVEMKKATNPIQQGKPGPLPTSTPAKYPILIRVVQGYLVASVPDFDFHLSERIEQISEKGIGNLIVQLWKKCDLRLRELSQKQELPPEASSQKTLFPSPHQATSWKIQEVSRITGLSQATIRRAVERGDLHCALTPRGHRRFREADVRAWLEKISQ